MTDLSTFKGKKRKLLEYMLDPEHRHMSVTDICEALAISRTYFYDCAKDQDFDTTLNDVKNRCFNRYLARIDKRMAEQAVEGDTKAARLIYEIKGQVGGRGSTVNVAVHDQPKPQTLPIDTPEDIERAIAHCKSEMDTLRELMANLENMRAGNRSRTEAIMVVEQEKDQK
jgi:hypothetical protein